MKRGVLLVNLGSPDSPQTGDVRRYLREFLMDGRVLDAPFPIRFGVVHFAILPFRPKQSGEAYEKIWTEHGSPLIVTSRNVRALLQGRVDPPVELAMRYQNPSVPSAIEKLNAAGVTQLLLIPLFPHYAMSSYETAVARVQEVAAKIAPQMRIDVQPPYFADADYIEALVANTAHHLTGEWDHLLFSFHGIPERHLRKSDRTGCHCLTTPDCCDRPSPAHATCYRHQCFETVKAFVARAGIPADKFSVSFQSRLGRDPWLKPYTDLVIPELAQRGIRKLLVMCPAFVADCLETLEEIGMRGAESFREAGGEELALVPCLNEHPRWIDTLERMVVQWAGMAEPAVAAGANRN